MDTGTFSMIIFGILIIVGGYLIISDSVSGQSKMILIVVITLMTIALILNLGLFSKGKTAITSPVSAMSKIDDIKKYKYTASYSVSMWIYVSDWNVKPGVAKEIIKRSVKVMGESTKVHNPRISLAPYANQINIDFCTDSTNSNSAPVLQTIKIPNIQTQKWVNITCCFSDTNIDTYINGKLVDTTVPPNNLYYPTYKSTDSQDDLNIKICPNSVGFSGMISNVSYYDHMLTPQDAWNIYQKGYSSNMFGNLLNKYNASFTFYDNQNEVAQFYIM